jgi:aryl-alcohol dehydrogenase-like predicted oxidoreductase
VELRSAPRAGWDGLAPMPQRMLGSTGIAVSVLGLGTVKIGRTRGLKYPGDPPTRLPNDDEVEALFRTACELGINLIDTAPAYGESEARIGSIMRRLGWLGGRARWVVVTKAGEMFDDATGESRFDFSPAGVRTSVERSLSRLGVAELDAVLLHSDGRDAWIAERSGALETLEDMKRAGLIRAVGMSTKTPAGGLLAAELSDVVMLTLNPANQDDLPAVARARSLGRGVLIKKALASGHAASPAAALQTAAATPGVSSVVVGTGSPARLRENAQALTSPEAR